MGVGSAGDQEIGGGQEETGFRGRVLCPPFFLSLSLTFANACDVSLCFVNRCTRRTFSYENVSRPVRGRGSQRTAHPVHTRPNVPAHHHVPRG